MKIKPCPFCGEQSDNPDFETNQGTKWGRLECVYCSSSGPEVRTNYDSGPEADWHKDAIKEWNKRK